ncbi:MAG: hypothetical protein PHY92_02000 [Alphaproteobacteria bacterium]|nr:hypothetical protein [Alphaproteobacteria bacterium]
MDKPKILFVTTDAEERSSLLDPDHIYSLNFDVVVCVPGEFSQTLDAAYAAKTSFNVFVFALGMEHLSVPRYDVYQTNIEYLKALHQVVFGFGSSRPGIVLLSLGEKAEVLHFANEIKRQTQFDNVLAIQKPIEPEDLVHAIRRLAGGEKLDADAFLYDEPLRAPTKAKVQPIKPRVHDRRY